jgi:DNA helicase HerA-like ATPase
VPGLARGEWIGYVSLVESYSRLKAYVLETQGYTPLARYGALVEVVDSEDPQTRYLAVVEDVSERGILPQVDHSALQALIRSLRSSGASLERVDEALRRIVFPGVQRQFGVREATLRVLGEIHTASGGVEVRLHRRPPRPYSRIHPADERLVEKLLGGDCGSLVLGFHSTVEDAPVAINPGGLTTHLAVVGQTGSGKTETVKRIVLELAARSGGAASIVVFDVHGEYIGHPYKPTRGVTLLDALLHPDEYICEPRPSCRTSLNPQAPGSLTVAVPYSLAQIGLRKEGERRYFETYRGFAGHLREALRGVERDLKVALFGRHAAYTLDSAGRLAEVGLGEALRLVDEARDLLVALPHPDAMSVDEIVAYSGTKSEYVPAELPRLADALYLLEGDTVAGITLLSSLLQARRSLKDLGAPTTLLTKAMSRLVESVDQAAQEESSLSAHGLSSMLRGILSNLAAMHAARRGWEPPFIHGESLRYLLLLPLWRGWVELPEGSGWPHRLCDPNIYRAALEAPVPGSGRKWGAELPQAVARANKMLDALSDATEAAMRRALGKVSLAVSPLLGLEAYLRVAGRITGAGVAFVHLAPPSTGAAELPVARLLGGLYSAAVDRYARGERRSTILVVEEAHNLAPPTGRAPTKPPLLRIAREGRKWGLSLVLVTQRPGFVDPDILSQAASLVALRVTNPDDISGIRRSVESSTSGLVDRLPDLDVGQAIVSGPVLRERRIPALVNIVALHDAQARCTPPPSGAA